MPDQRIGVQVPYLALTQIDLPREVEQLYDLAYNLWWSWSPAARQLFAAVDSAAWALYRNPVQLLLSVDRPHWERLIEDEAFMGAYSRVMRDFRSYREGSGGTWFARAFPDYAGRPIAYFSMEYGVHQSLAIYSGGLGVLSGDHCKAASDLGLPFAAVGLLYRFGYFRQTIDADGIQQHTYPEYDFSRLPVRPVAGRTGGELVVTVPFPGRDVRVKVWVIQIGRVPLLLLDTDVAENDPGDRPITRLLYVRGREMRLAQEMVLGAGGARALAAIGLEPEVWHMNEGHSALLQLERARQLLSSGWGSLDEALAAVRADTAFTTHTPVAAGHEEFDAGLAAKYLGAWSGEGIPLDRLLALGRADHGEAGQAWNLTAFALRTSAWANGVSRINAAVSNRMWRHLFPPGASHAPDAEPIRAVTNGVHVPTWLGLEMRELLESVLGPVSGWDLLPASAWEAVHGIADAELWAAHQAQKERLARFTRARLRDQLARYGRSPDELRAIGGVFDPEAMTIGFARRFATYKRASLVFRDLHRLRQILGHWQRPVQILFAGKAHPADRPGQELIQHIFQLSQEESLRGRVVFVENHDMRIARMLVQGADLWLNTPRPPLEASGTSGQKAAINGVLHCSVLDGWWPEGYDGQNGWAIAGEEPAREDWDQDQQDALALYRLLEEEVVPAFYERDENGLPRRWIARMKRSIATIAPRFSASRMVREYTEEAYMPLAARRATPAGKRGE